MKVLVVNAGSSSLKYKVIDMQFRSVVCSGIVERIGLADSVLSHKQNEGKPDEAKIMVGKIFEDHNAAIQAVAELLRDRDSGVLKDPGELLAIGHRVAQGGELFKENCIIDQDVIAGIEETIPLAPLHNPANLAGIKAAMELFPDTPSVAVFDTQFSKDIPPHAYRYAVPDSLYIDYKVRRYGFHGTSHRYVARELAEVMGKSPEDLNLIVCHLGNGSSMTAVKGGVCQDTSMGMTPLAGLMMGTRCGDIDPAIHKYLADTAGMGLDEIDALLNRESGLTGICGMSDLRDMHVAIEDGNDKAQLALDMLCYGIKKYIGAYHAVLGCLDAIAFTAGIGENDAVVRATSLAGLEPMGIVIDNERNNAAEKGARKISAENSRVQVWVIPTDEELEIATACLDLVTE